MLDLLRKAKVDTEWQGGSTPLCSDCNMRITSGSFEFHQAKRSGEVRFNLYCNECTKGRNLGEEYGYFKNYETGGYNYYPDLARKTVS
jgi:hypothetical protein